MRRLVLTTLYAVPSPFFAQRQLTSMLSPVDGAISAFVTFLRCKFQKEEHGKGRHELHFHHAVCASKIITLLITCTCLKLLS